MMEAVRTSETSVNFNVIARRYIPEAFKPQLIFVMVKDYVSLETENFRYN
jgi:hypothetical protein